MATGSPGGGDAPQSDPAALLGAALAGALSITLAPGAYSILSTIIGATLLLVIHSYDNKSDVRKYRRTPGPWYTKLWVMAFGAVWSLCFFLTIAVVLEYTIGDPTAEDSEISEWLVFGLWLVCTVAVTLVRLRSKA